MPVKPDGQFITVPVVFHRAMVDKLKDITAAERERGEPATLSGTVRRLVGIGLGANHHAPVSDNVASHHEGKAA
jgi:hypothetical protein